MSFLKFHMVTESPSGKTRGGVPGYPGTGDTTMTMRVTIENTDESGRVIEVQQEDQTHECAWQRSDHATLAKGEKRHWYIHAARRLIVTENPTP